MKLADFLNPPDEAHGIDVGTDKDIFDAVIEVGREEGRYDGDDSDSLDAEPIPTRVEVLKVLKQHQRLSAAIHWTKTHAYGAYFRELKSISALFGQRTCTIN